MAQWTGWKDAIILVLRLWELRLSGLPLGTELENMGTNTQIPLFAQTLAKLSSFGGQDWACLGKNFSLTSYYTEDTMNNGKWNMVLIYS